MRIRLELGRIKRPIQHYSPGITALLSQPSGVVTVLTRWLIVCVFGALASACAGQAPPLESHARTGAAKDYNDYGGSVEKSRKATKRRHTAKRQSPRRALASRDDIGIDTNSGSYSKSDYRGAKTRVAKNKSRSSAKSRRQQRVGRAELVHTASYDRTRTTTIHKRKRKSRVVKRKRRRVTRIAKNNRGSRRHSSFLMAAVKRHAREAGVPTSVGLAIVQQESGFNPKARGLVGEIGLMQVKCTTARTMGYRGSCADLYNVNTNLRYGMKYLKKAIRKGSVGYYNAGISAKKLPPQARKYARSVASKRRGY